MKSFVALIKPASSLCNMCCNYCFYHDVADNRNVPSYGFMVRETSQCLIDKIINSVSRSATVTFAFQGGEPTLAGLPFFKHFVYYAKIKNGGKCSINFSIQTNGILLDDNWCSFLSEHNFLVGISVDSGPDFHDRNRIDKNGKGTWSIVNSNIRLLDKYKVDYNILTVITKDLARHPKAVFNRFLRDKRRYLQFIPCLKPLGACENQPHDITPRLYAQFLKSIFRLWAERLTTDDPVSIRQFDNLLMVTKGYASEQCGLSGSCIPQFVVEADGSVFPCDFYVLDNYICGNIHNNSIDEIRRSEGVKKFLADAIPMAAECRDCPVIEYCKGGCNRYRLFYREEEGYCPNRDFLTEAVPVLKRLAALL